MAGELHLDGNSTALAPGETLFAAAARCGAAVPSSCRGQGKCRECLVEIAHGAEALSPPAPEERHLTGSFRLACCARLAADGARVGAHTLRRAALRVETAATALPPAAALARLDPAVTRDGDRILLDGREIARGRGPLHGLAIDLGTTTVAVRCLNLETGATVAAVAFENPQRFGGSDVMARIQYDTDHPGRLLQRTVLGYLARAICELPVPPDSIFELAVAGNPTMRDLFFGFDVRSIGQMPYRSQTEHDFRAGRRLTTAVEAAAGSLRLPVHPAARVYGLPLVSGHVGADAAACLLALVPHRGDEVVAIMDIGTNTEVFVGNRRRLLAASCPAGPAFEGRAIRCGMPALDGAVARVAVDEAGAPHCEVIGGGAPAGICGSGLVDLLSELLRTGRMNGYGRFTDGSDAFPVDPAHGIALYESDVNELAQAKGANIAGLTLVAKHFGVAPADLRRLYLAGGFGRHLDPGAARRIGLIPPLPAERVSTVGNAAIEGAAIALLSVSARRELEQLVGRVEHVQLETDPDFFDHFVSGCLFGPAGATVAEVPS
jgi:uncharacterized 2Fe-2S/4Fe-4S cluster protein (DUF4445 family)